MVVTVWVGLSGVLSEKNIGVAFRKKINFLNIYYRACLKLTNFVLINNWVKFFIFCLFMGLLSAFLLVFSLRCVLF